MKPDDVVSFIKKQERDIEFFKKKIERLKTQIEDIKSISTQFDQNTIYSDEMKSEYSKEEICVAYNRMLKYEGYKHREGTLITDTFMEFLIGTHHSLRNKDSSS